MLEPLGADVSARSSSTRTVSFEPQPQSRGCGGHGQRGDATVKARLTWASSLTRTSCSAVIDGDGNPINRNKLIALLAAIILDEHPGSTVVTDSVTSDGLAEFIEGKGGKHVRYMRGYKNVINEGVRRDKAGEPCHLMIETSGHGAMKENYCLDDGAYIAVKIIIEAVRRRLSGGKGISDLLSELRAPRGEEVRRGLRRLQAYGGDVSSSSRRRWAP